MSSPELNETPQVEMKRKGTPVDISREQLGEMIESAPDWDVAVKPPSLREKLSRVAAHCAYIQKDGVNTHFNYNYARASDVFERVNEALIANRLVSSTWFDIVSHEAGLVMVRCRIDIHDIDSESSISWNGFGSGQDKGDKAVMKAQTAALKYAWIMGLNISTGDDPEDPRIDASAPQEPARPQKTAQEYTERVERNKTAPLSPLGEKALELANEEADLSPALKASLAKIKEAKQWTAPSREEIQGVMGPTEDEDRCETCGAALVERHASKGKGGYAYTVCEECEKVFKETGKGLKGHHWKRV